MKDHGVFDVAADLSPSLLGPGVVEFLALKGFCAVDLGLEPALLTQAVREVDRLHSAGRFQRPSGLIVGGLLGHDGSAEIAHLEPPDASADGGGDGEALATLDAAMSTMGGRLFQFAPQLGFELEDRSMAVLHQTGADPRGREPPLPETEWQKWLTQFWWHRIMAIIFLGPEKGTLELEPLASTDANVHQVTTSPGMMVLLRPDVLAHSHSAGGRAVALSCFFMQAVTEPRPPPTPTVTAMVAWMADTMKIMKQQDAAGEELGISRNFTRMMNHLYHKAPRTAVRTVTTRLPSTWDADAFNKSLYAGIDLMTEVPVCRWNRASPEQGGYHPDEDSWRTGMHSHIRHVSCVDGAELFDCKMFALSPNESLGMDPVQRGTLEVAYEGLWNAGLRKRDMHNSPTAVYLGFSTGDFGAAEKTKEAERAMNSGSGVVMCIYSNRVNYCLGLKGPSLTIDQGAASGLTAAHLAAGAVAQQWSNGDERRGAISRYALGMGAFMLFSPRGLAMQTSLGCLSPVGRSFTFDASANGFCLGDCVAGLAVKALLDYTDGDPVWNEAEWPPVGILCSTGTNSSGRGTCLRAPYGPAIQDLVGEALSASHISPLDVDNAEVHGEGRIMPDIIDTSTALLALRGTVSDRDEHLPVLPLGAVKTCAGHNKEGTALPALAKALLSSQWAVAAPNCHLRQLTPHLDVEVLGEVATFNTELMQVGVRCSAPACYTSIVAHGFGGSNSHAIVWGSPIGHNTLPIKGPPLQREEFTFWPAGGGELEDSVTDCKEYWIIGTWMQWSESAKMQPEGDGCFGFTVDLGENGWEQFQILMDGDAQRVLHPGVRGAPKNSEVLGPHEGMLASENRWMIDGRKPVMSAPLDQLAINGGESVGDGDSASNPVELETVDAGEPGDAYRIHLRIAGRWRVVTWERLGQISPVEAPLRKDGGYFIAGSFNDWTFEEMTHSFDKSGLVFSVEVHLDTYGSEFQIVRDRDWEQAFFPAVHCGASDEEVLGPSGESGDRSWRLAGDPGDRVSITFQRVQLHGADLPRVSWRRLP